MARVDEALTATGLVARALGGQWSPVRSSWGPVLAQLVWLGSGAAGFVFVKPPNESQHAWVAMNRGGRLVWVETQAAGGERVREDPPLLPVEARVIVVGPDGVVVPLVHWVPGAW